MIETLPGASPGPESRTATSTPSGVGLPAADEQFSASRRWCRSSPRLALMIKLRITCCSCTRSPSMSGKPVREFRPYRDAVLDRFATGELNHLADRLVDVQALLPGRRLLDESTDPVDDFCPLA